MQHKTLVKITCSFLVLLLTACATLPPTTTQPSLTWQQRQAQLRQLHNWTLRSAFSIRDQQQVSMASLLWQQQGRYFYQRIAGPFNLGGVTIIGTPGKVTLTKSPTEKVTAASPEQLLETELNMRLPVSNMYYWVRGIPMSGVRVRNEQFDASNHLVSLQQQGWQINYLSFTNVNGIDLPNKIQFNNNGLAIKLVIKQWQI